MQTPAIKHVFGLLLALLPVAALASEPEDTCRYFGEDFPQGAVICSDTPGGPRLNECAMALNNPTWKVRQEACAPAREQKPRTSGKALDYVKDYLKSK